MELSKIFTRLQIVGRKKERARLTKNIVKMTDVFRPRKECEKPRVVLIEGEPGMGKTTYCQKLAYDWSVEDISPEASFPKVDMLLKLKCRDMKTANIEDAIDDQLLPLDVDNTDKENFFRFIRCNQSRILLVLDGLDELPQDLLEGLLPLIQGRVFPNIYLMLTARHEIGMKVRKHCDTLFEIVGYTNEDTDSYIVKYFSNHDDPSLAKTLIKNLDWNPQLRELTANPLNTALLCLVCEDAHGIFPYNRTMLYDDLVSCVLRRNFSKKGIPMDNKYPIEVCADQLNQLGKLALEALLETKLAFIPGELKNYSAEYLEFGFLSREASASKMNPKPSYAFTHKTFQEYFAAFYLAHELLTGESDKAALLAQLSPVDKYWQVWEFLITMAASKSDEIAVLLVSSLCASFPRNYDEFHYHDHYVQQEDYSRDNTDDSSDSDDLVMYPTYNYDADDSKYDCSYKNDHDDDADDEDHNDHHYNFIADVCKDISFDWNKGPSDLLVEKSEEEALVTTTIYTIAQCERPKSELKLYQIKMAATLARCFPLDKILVNNFYESTSFASRYMLLLSEYVKGNCQLEILLWWEKLDKLALATIEHVLQSSHRLTFLYVKDVFNITSLIPALQANRSLEYLNGRDVRIGNAGAKAL